jgi:hypothetical protein
VPELLGVALAVALKCVRVLVVVPAVQLDDQVVLGEVGVDLAAVDLDVDERGRQPVLGDEREEVVLERGARRVRGGVGERGQEPGADVVGVAARRSPKVSGCR